MTQLMHPRVAANYAVMGYYPTDEGTIHLISSFILPGNERIKFLDPCCGCASALALLSHHDRYPFATRYGIEQDRERAQTAKSKLNEVLCGSAFDVRVTPQSVDCLFLNPPYGQALNDKEYEEKGERLEYQFLHHFFSALRSGGLLIYIIPATSMNEKYRKWFAVRFEHLQIFKAVSQRFNQIVIMGIKRSLQIGAAEIFSENSILSDMSEEKFRYRLTENTKTLRMITKSLTVEGLSTLRQECRSLWHDFDTYFSVSSDNAAVRPLHDLTDWHTCLLISSGLVGGIVDNGERRLLIKGCTTKIRTVKNEEDNDGNIICTEYRERFHTVIKAIDLTPHSSKFGSIIHIR